MWTALPWPGIGRNRGGGLHPAAIGSTEVAELVPQLPFGSEHPLVRYLELAFTHSREPSPDRGLIYKAHGSSAVSARTSDPNAPPVSPTEASPLHRLRDLVARLRAPDGCPWDRQQTLADIRGYVLEEAHELAAAVDSGDWGETANELGDLLFQVAYVTQLGEEAGALTLEGVATAIERKMIDRHPHVFAGDTLETAAAVERAWERRKLATEGRSSLLEGIPTSLPALLGAYRIGQKVAGVGFDWPDRDGVREKLDEELAELDAALAGDTAGPAVSEELGDVLFAVANLARHLRVDPETALAAANRKFRRRFEALEQRLAASGSSIDAASLDELEQAWQAVKAAEG